MRKLLLLVVFFVSALAANEANATCSDNLQNGGETGIDCGGPCLACEGAVCSANAQCRSGSCVDSSCAVVYSVDTSTGVTNVQRMGTVVVDPTLVIAGNGFVDGATVIVQGAFDPLDDELTWSPTPNTYGVYDASIGVLTFYGFASVAEYQELFRSVKFTPYGLEAGDRNITFALGPNGLSFADNGHFYEFVDGYQRWEDAAVQATQRRYLGLKGYLVTVTTEAENGFVAGKLQGQGWMGANDSAVEGNWRWTAGPEGLEDGGQGRHFFTQTPNGVGGTPTIGLRKDLQGTSCTANTQCASGVCDGSNCRNYDNWDSSPDHSHQARGEPNNCCGNTNGGIGEDFGHFLLNAEWNDYYTNNFSISGYVVEYGGMPGDPPQVLQDSKTVRIVSVSCNNGIKDGSETAIDCGGSCGPCTPGFACQVNADCTSTVCSGLVCQAPSCFDNVRNGSETDLDCGGSCVADCANNLGCNANGDCQSGKCTSNVCQAPTCSDSVRNNGETDVDCGGPICGDCANGNACDAGGDCQSAICQNHICQSAACTDGTQNGGETDVDCGGPCGPCDPGEHCGGGNDCTSQVCSGTTCQAPTCFDGARNGNETGADCGGSCAADCAVGGGCQSGADCQSGSCANSTCQPATCLDGVKNAAETGIDCGGPTCGDCGSGQGCLGDGDCVSSVCTGLVCQAPTCADGRRNGNESDLDCGGACGATCTSGKHCEGSGDCRDRNCAETTCQAASCNDNVLNGGESDVDCGGPCGATCGVEDDCAGDDDCESTFCNAGHCAVPSCNDGVRNQDETDVDCGGASCERCDAGEGCDDADDCTTMACTGGFCTQTCDDGALNQDESDTDCGGVCERCDAGQLCNGASDCGSGVCIGTCQAPACDDGVMNGGEAQVDCAGESSCGPCDDGSPCDDGTQCQSAVCFANVCRAPQCNDGVINGDESDLDCGGACPACAFGKSCDDPGDCLTGTCDAGLCACGEGEVLSSDGVTCIALGECDGFATCDLQHTLVFFGPVTDASQQAIGSIRCERTPDGKVDCDHDPVTGELTVRPELWCSER